MASETPGLTAPDSTVSNMAASGISVEERKLTFPPFQAIGRSGLKQYAGFVLEEFLVNLRGANGAKAYREILDNSALVGGIYRLIQLAMRQVEKFVEPYKGQGDETTPQDEERAERVKQALDDMSHSWEDTMCEICSMIPYGYAPMELTYKKCSGWTEDPATRSRYSDGLITWRKIELRSQDTLFRWDFDPEGGVKAFLQLAPPDYTLRTLPIEKLLLFRPEVEKGNPEGKSVLRSAYFNWLMIKRLIEFEGIKGEKDASGIPVVKIPAVSIKNRDSVWSYAKKLASTVRVDDQNGFVISSDTFPESQVPMFGIELLGKGGGTGSSYDYDKVITRHETRLAMSMLAGAAMLGHDKVGSFALSKEKNKNEFALGLTAWLDSIFSVLNRHAIPRLFMLNGWPMDRMCQMKHGRVQEEDIDALATAALKLSQAGMAVFPDDDLENQIRSEAGWPSKKFETPPEMFDPNDPTYQERHMPPQMQGDGQKADGGKKPFGQDGPEKGGKDPKEDQKGKNPKGKPFGKRSDRPQNNLGRFANRTGTIVNAIELLRDRRSVTANDRIHHGFKTADPTPFDPKAMTHTLDLEGASVERVKLKDLIATQPDVNREGVRVHIENGGMVLPGQRSLSGQLVDRPVVIRHKDKNYIADGHHRLSAKMLLGYEDALVRVVDMEASLNDSTTLKASLDRLRETVEGKE